MVGALEVGAGAPSGPCCPLRGLGEAGHGAVGQRGRCPARATLPSEARMGHGSGWREQGRQEQGQVAVTPPWAGQVLWVSPPVGSSAHILCPHSRHWQGVTKRDAQ